MRLYDPGTLAGFSNVCAAFQHYRYNEVSDTPLFLLTDSERSNNMQPIYPHNISVSPTGHVLLTLDTLARAGPGGVGRDLLVWGANQEYQLGNGKRGSIASPTALHSPEGHRFMLGKRKADVKDLSGQIWKKGVDVEQYALAGWGNSVVYWRICR